MRKRPLLVVSAGVAVITVLEGIACGNPVAPPMPIDAPSDTLVDGTAQGDRRDQPQALPGDAGITTTKP